MTNIKLPITENYDFRKIIGSIEIKADDIEKFKNPVVTFGYNTNNGEIVSFSVIEHDSLKKDALYIPIKKPS